MIPFPYFSPNIVSEYDQEIPQLQTADKVLIRKYTTNSEESDQTPHYLVSDLGLHCLPMAVHMNVHITNCQFISKK